MELKKLSKLGNKKIGRDTIIFNLNAAMDCPSDRKGLCTVSEICYAKKPERQYKAVLSYRRKQAEYWQQSSALEFVRDLVDSYSNYIEKGKIRYLRFNEAGDMDTDQDIIKMNTIAELLIEYNIRVYTYTASDVDLKHATSTNFALTLSDKVNTNFNTFTAIERGTFKLETSKDKLCPADCSKCTWCKVNRGFNIYVEKH